MNPNERLEQIAENLFDGDLQRALQDIEGVENDLPVYRTMNTPIWKIQSAKNEIKRLRDWIAEEQKNNRRD